MAEEIRDFSHESLQDRESILRYLEALGQGLKRGELRLSSGREAFVLKTPTLMQLEVRARQKRSRVDLIVKVSWKNRRIRASKVEPLTVDEDDR
jgi:amphi-Trp domain-containing protein